MAPRAAERQARQDHVAEALARAAGAGNVDAPADNRLVLRQLAAERRGLVLAAAARQVGEPRGDLLQAGDIGVGDAAKLGGDARRIDHAVEAAAPLDIPADYAHLPGPEQIPVALIVVVGQQKQQGETTA
jgi:hypothetical protein